MVDGRRGLGPVNPQPHVRTFRFCSGSGATAESYSLMVTLLSLTGKKIAAAVQGALDAIFCAVACLHSRQLSTGL